MANQLLKGKKGLIFGALNEQSIAWKVAEKAVEEGAEIVLTNTAVSMRMGAIQRLAEKCGTIVVPADATNVEELENLFDKTMEHFGGGFDFMLHSIGMSPNVRKGFAYDNLNYDFLNKTLDISAVSFHKAMQVARRKDAINEWGSIVALTYMAAQRTVCAPAGGGDLHAQRRVQALRRRVHRHPDLHQDGAWRHGQCVVLRHARRRLHPG